MIDKETIVLVVILLIMGVTFYRRLNILDTNIELLETENKEFNLKYEKDLKRFSHRFKMIDSKLSTIPKVNKNIDTKVNELIKQQKQSLEDYVISSFSKVDKDILFESKINEHISRSISLQKILKNEDSKYSDYFKNLLNNVQIFNSSIYTAKKDIEKVKEDISKSLKDINEKSSNFEEYYSKGKKNSKNIFKRIEILEEIIKEGDSISTRNGESDSNTFDDDSFRIEKSDIKDLNGLEIDEPKDDKDYRSRYI